MNKSQVLGRMLDVYPTSSVDYWDDEGKCNSVSMMFKKPCSVIEIPIDILEAGWLVYSIGNYKAPHYTVIKMVNPNIYE